MAWPVAPLPEVLDFQEGPGILALDFRQDGIPLIRLAGIKSSNSSLLVGCNYLDPEKVAKKWQHFQIEERDVLLSTSASLGDVAIADASSAGAIPYTGIIRFRPLCKKMLPEFVAYYFRSQHFAAQIEAMGAGSVMRHFGPMHLRQMKVLAPPLSEQQAIAELLGSLDDKIAANSRIVDTFDLLVRKLYSAIPLSQTSLGDLCINVREQVQPSGRVPYVGLEHVGRHHMWLHEQGTSDQVTSAKSSFRLGDVLFGKLRPYFHKVVSAPMAGVCSTDILVLRAKESDLSGYVLAAASSTEVIDHSTVRSAGTKMPRASWADLSQAPIRWVDRQAASNLSESVNTFRDAAEAAVRESRTLAQLRDTLLPALMDGRLRVRDAINQAEDIL